MLDCHQATRLSSEELDRPLTWAERLGLALHTMMCKGCTNYRRQMAFLRAASRRFADGGAAGKAERRNEPD